MAATSLRSATTLADAEQAREAVVVSTLAQCLLVQDRQRFADHLPAPSLRPQRCPDVARVVTEPDLRRVVAEVGGGGRPGP